MPHWRPLEAKQAKEELDPGDLALPGRYSRLTSPPSPLPQMRYPLQEVPSRVPGRNLQGSVPEENNQFRTSANTEKVSMSYQFPDGKKSKSGCVRPSLLSPFLQGIGPCLWGQGQRQGGEMEKKPILTHSATSPADPGCQRILGYGRGKNLHLDIILSDI